MWIFKKNFTFSISQGFVVVFIRRGCGFFRDFAGIMAKSQRSLKKCRSMPILDKESEGIDKNPEKSRNSNPWPTSPKILKDPDSFFERPFKMGSLLKWIPKNPVKSHQNPENPELHSQDPKSIPKIPILNQ